MDHYTFIATSMRAVRLFAFVLCLGIIWCWGPSLWRLLSGRAPAPAFIREETAESVALDRERTRAIWSLMAAGILLIQLRWLSPWLPAASQMQIWLAGISTTDMVMLGAIFLHGRADPRFQIRRTAILWLSVFFCCVGFAVVSR